MSIHYGLPGQCGNNLSLLGVSGNKFQQLMGFAMEDDTVWIVCGVLLSCVKIKEPVVALKEAND